MSVAGEAPAGRVGKYELLARLGGGGMAEVFRGRVRGVEGFSRTVAIKRVLPGFSENPAFAAMFVSEAGVCSRMQHPNVVSVIDFDRDADGRLFLVMELVEGSDLEGLMQTGPLSHGAVIYITTEILHGLGYAHDLPDGGVDRAGRTIRGVVHRDVSPHNVLLSWEGAVKVSDFGIAKARAQSAATASEIVKGKPAYMSPEQANGAAIDGRSDLFAVGIMLWEMLTGERLFIGDTREALAQVFFKPIPRPSELRAVAPDLEAVTMRLLARDLPHRYARAEDAIDDLAACVDAPRDGRSELVRLLADRFASAPRTTRRVRSPAASPVGRVDPGSPARSAPPVASARASVETAAEPSPRRWPIFLVLGVLGAVAALTVIAAVGGSHKQRTAAPARATGAAQVDAGAALPDAPSPDAALPDAAPRAIDARPSRPDGRAKHGRGHGSAADQIHEVNVGEH